MAQDQTPQPHGQVTDADIDNRTKHHIPDDGQRKRYALIRQACNQLAKFIRENTPASREQTKAIGLVTDEVMMLANAAIARNEVRQGKIDPDTCVECGRAKEVKK